MKRMEIRKSGQEQYPAVRYKQVREEGKGLTPFLKKEWRGERATWKLVTVVQTKNMKETGTLLVQSVSYK